MERVSYFRNPEKFVTEIKRLISSVVEESEVYIFGSVIRGDYSPGLSDIDVAIVSDEFEDRKKKLEVYDMLFERYFHTPFEFHVLTGKQWRFYRRFIRRRHAEGVKTTRKWEVNQGEKSGRTKISKS